MKEQKRVSRDLYASIMPWDRAFKGYARVLSECRGARKEIHVRLAENSRTSLADNHCLGVREDSGDCKTAGTLDIHEERSGRRDESLSMVLTFRALDRVPRGYFTFSLCLRASA